MFAVRTLAVFLLLPYALSGQQISIEEIVSRRARMMDRIGDGILLLHARTLEKAMEQPSFVQDASFLYFTGLPNQAGAILALDGATGESRLFVPPPPRSFGMVVEELVLEPGDVSARRHGLSSVESWDAFVPYLRGRVTEGVQTFFVDESRRPESRGVPDELLPVAGDDTLWRTSLAAAFPEITIESAQQAIRAMRWVKSEAEVALLRQNALATSAALLAGVRSVRPGTTQRAAEVAVVSGCVAAGAEGPSFWPWMMSGPNGHAPRLVRAFYDYNHLNRTMQAGELVRVDVGCAGDSYGGDVGRTIPVSGFFDAGQRETWNLLIDAYRAGLATMRPGVTIDQVMESSRAEIVAQTSALETAQARGAAMALASEGGMAMWSIHGVGIDSGETPLDVLEKGCVIAFEPMFSYGRHAYYLEDMIVITDSGYEVLSVGLPYTAEEIEDVMRTP